MIDDLVQRLRAIDPCPPDVPIERADSPSAQALMEQIMDTEVSFEVTESPNRSRRRMVAAALAAAAAVALILAGAVVFGDSDGDEPVTVDPAPSAPTEPDTLETFTLAASDPLTQMCLPVADAVIPPNAAAFAGTVVSTEPAGTVRLDVDRWFTAGDADAVVLESGTNVSVALDGVEFTVNEQYLVTVVDGTVAICGVSGPATPELEQLYEQWYG